MRRFMYVDYMKGIDEAAARADEKLAAVAERRLVKVAVIRDPSVPPGEPAPLWPYFALPGVGLLVLAGLVYGRRKEAI